MHQEKREKVIVWVSISAFVVGVILTFMGLLLPPIGIIDNSVLVASGQFFTLTAGGLGLKEYVDGSITKTRMHLEAENDRKSIDK